MSTPEILDEPSPPAMKYVYLIRHGQSLDNAQGNRLSGLRDTPLTDEGRRQCRDLASALRRMRIEIVYSSPLTRAIESAKLMFPKKARPVICPHLIEFDYGHYEGRISDPRRSNDPILKKWRTAPARLRFPGGGNIGHHARVVYDALSHLIEASPARSMAWITHKTTGRLFVAKALGLDLNRFRLIPLQNCSVTVFRWNLADGIRLQALNVSQCDLRLKIRKETAR